MADRYAAYISYAHRYQEWVAILQRNLESCLEASGADPARVFLDKTDLASGRPWVTQLQEGLAKSGHLILVATPEALASPRVEDEYRSFVAARRDWAQGFFHIAMLVDTPLPPFVDPIHCLDFVDHDNEKYRGALRKLVGSLLGTPARDGPDLPLGFTIPPPPSGVLATDLRRRLLAWLAPLVKRKILRPAVADALGIEPARLEGYPTPETAASAALVAATGDDDRVQAARRIIRALRDAFEEEDDLLKELDSLDNELKCFGNGQGGLIDAWLTRVARDHSNLVPIFEQAGLELLDRVYVQLELRPKELWSRGQEEWILARGRPHWTIRDLLALERGEHAWVTHRWVVRGDPGAGKTTLLRHLAVTLATEKGRRWVPIFESLPRLMREPEFLLPRLERQLLRAGAEVKGLASALESEARNGRLLLLLDGLDEVPRERREEAEATLRDFSTLWPETPIVVTSRPIGYRRPGSEFVELDLLAFDEGQRRQFLGRWFGRSDATANSRRASEAMKILRGDAGLWDLSGNPLYLTLMALLFEEGKEPDRNRATLYDQVFDLLLDGRYKPEGKPIDAKKAVYALLRRLSYDMTGDNRDAESRADIEARLYQADYDELRKALFRVPAWRGGLGTFLVDLSEKTGILGPHDGPRADWRYWHRTFPEALSAEQLAEDLQARGEAAILEKARAVAGDEGRWAEPFALLVGRVEDPDALVTSLVEANRGLGLWAVATAQRLSDETVRAVLHLTEDWQDRSKVFREIPDLVDDPERAVALVDQIRQRTRNGNDLFFLDETLSVISERWEDAKRIVRQLRERFYDHIPPPSEELFRWIETPHDGRVELWREIPAGEGWVGAAVGEPDYDYDLERPRHRVTLTRPFSMAAVPVTNTQYAAFDPDHSWEKWDGVSRDEVAYHPVVKVTWYAATAFCRWLTTYFPGARLPTEEEWEYACRAGTETRYWNGDSEKDLDQVGWYDENSGQRTHRVGERSANPSKLYYLHGNVWEWMANAYDDGDAFFQAYKGREKGVAIDPANVSGSAADAGGGERVARGGSYRSTAVRARAACRYIRSAGREILTRGFRVLLPPPSPQGNP